MNRVRWAIVAGVAAMLSGCGGSSGGGGGGANDNLYILYYNGSDNVLATISSDNPGDVNDIGELNFANDFIIGLDRRPFNDELYAYSLDADQLLTVNKLSGQASIVGTNGSGVPSPIGIDFNPVADLLRLVSFDADNLRLDPDTGGLFATDTDLNPAPDMHDVAYTNNFDGATVTTLYGIDIGDDSLKRIGGVDGSPSPNGGVVTNIGPLGVDFDFAQFDIDSDGFAWAIDSQSSGGGFTNRLYSINLNTGAATLVGTINISDEIVGMTAR